MNGLRKLACYNPGFAYSLRAGVPKRFTVKIVQKPTRNKQCHQRFRQRQRYRHKTKRSYHKPCERRLLATSEKGKYLCSEILIAAVYVAGHYPTRRLA